ncbi:hypothetical protein IMG5_095380 [Ichthyophthirius multifiliis]|uniref:Mitochondrial carrier protein n=1 Tax=Ichthyophthirius multifiliis TaxID=5932 RepID=G0QRN4_ICHMU|nr:hypothetical protein IMG5_095380 [Ichthyophthirius multifiliis]EGR32123.1 hypothetical protein IMG5_095380 [Ichthyophthirius multifiliis]|eukprot:XP_004035609.1 hypothetical protein IMG5_095380 [Ichthyophthirius multifiliis]
MSNSNQSLPMWVMMLTGGISGSIAETATIPFDTAKVRLQIQPGHAEAGKPLKYNGVLGTVKVMIKEEGFLSLYSGLNAGLQRQMVFASIRIGLYEPVRNFYSSKEELGQTPLYKKILAGLTTGCIGIMVANPTDLVKIRLQAEGKKPAGERRYNGVLDAYTKIVRTQGAAGLWQGLAPNIVRNSVINATELATYDESKQFFVSRKLLHDHSISTHMICSAIAGFVAAVVGSPVDVLKTRIMNSSSGSGTQYKGVLDCVFRTFQEDGFMAFYKGFVPNAQRIITWNICMFMSLHQIRKTVGETYYGINKNH